MGRNFTEQEKEHIRAGLCEACRQSWTQYGYKKTNVDDLCRQAGISKGAFYLFYESKEALFGEVLCSVQAQIFDTASEIIGRRKGKAGAAEALKFIYREYDKNNFLYHSDSADFTILTNRLSAEQTQKIKESEDRNRQLFSDGPDLTLKVAPALALSVIYSLIMNIKNKDILPFHHAETFDFMVDCIIDSLYE